MKRILTFLVVIFCVLESVAQVPKTVLDAPEGWRAEIIDFPLSFAPEIDLTGFEDIRFSPGWADSTSIDFWT